MTEQPSIVAIGGGGGATQVLRAVAAWSDRRTAVIAVTDTGRSTGLARTIGAIPAPGDVRATIAAFAHNQALAELLQYRFDGAGIPQLEGMAFGNLLIAALAQVRGDFGVAVAEVAQLVESSVRILPVSLANTHLCAELADGSHVVGELAVRGLAKPPIARLYLRDPAPANPAVLAAIRAADLVVIGPGSLFTTVLANLLFAGLREALREAVGTVVFIGNSTTQPGQTDGYRVVDHVQRVVELLGPGVVDVALLNSSRPAPERLAPYAAEGLHFLTVDPAEVAAIEALGVRVVLRALSETVGEKRVIWNKQDTIHYDPLVLGSALRDL